MMQLTALTTQSGWQWFWTSFQILLISNSSISDFLLVQFGWLSDYSLRKQKLPWTMLMWTAPSSLNQAACCNLVLDTRDQLMMWRKHRLKWQQSSYPGWKLYQRQVRIHKFCFVLFCFPHVWSNYAAVAGLSSTVVILTIKEPLFTFHMISYSFLPTNGNNKDVECRMTHYKK